MTTNPHLDMANDVFNRMFGLPIIAPPEPICELETNGLTDAQIEEGNLTSERL